MALCIAKPKKGIIPLGFLPPQPLILDRYKQTARSAAGLRNAPVYAPLWGAPLLGLSIHFNRYE